MAIADIAANPLLVPDATGEMLGFIEPTPAADVLHLDMYNFLINPIRQADRTVGQKGGNLFVKRYLAGPQSLWDTIQRRQFAVRDLWDITKIADEHLQYLKNIVGWTDQPLPKAITDRLTPIQLRKLIASSIALWRIRGSEEGYEAIVRVVTDARMRIWDWFDYRWIVDETALGEDHQGRDPYIIESSDDNLTDIRIVDDGNEDRTTIVLMVQFFKPGGERVEIHWIDFLDLFTIDGDDLQWDSIGAGEPSVAAGVYSLDDDSVAEEVLVIAPTAATWANYVVYYRIKFTQTATDVVGVTWSYVDSDNFVSVELDIANNEFKLYRTVAAAKGLLETYSFATHFETLTEDVFYGVRIVTSHVGDDLNTRVWIDSTLRVDSTIFVAAATTVEGSVSVFHETGSTLTLSEIELFQMPLDEDEIGL